MRPLLRRLSPALCALVVAACTEDAQSLGLTSVDAGPRGALDAGPGTITCDGLEEDACAAEGCFPQLCDGCLGRTYFAACTDGASVECPDLDCPGSCAELGEGACLGAGDNCRADYCPLCPGRAFVGCAQPEDPPPACPPIACPCEEHDEAACRDDSACHGVYAYDDPCFCDAPGCCMRFERCAEGRYTDCVGSDVLCNVPPPVCQEPFVVSFEGACYEGCVRPEACGP